MIKSSQQQSNHLKSSKPNEISLSGSFLTTRPKKKLKSSKQKNRYRPPKLQISLEPSPNSTNKSFVLTEMGKLTPELEQDRDIITNRKPALLSPASPSIENGIIYDRSSPRPLKRASTLFSSYDQTMFLNASKIFTALQHEPRDDGSYEAAQRRKAYKKLDKTVPSVQYESDQERRLTYQLAYTALKYQYVIEDLLQDIAFFIKYPETGNDLPLVTVVTSDYMQRKFLSRELHPGEIIYPTVKEVEDCIVESKIKLDAALARRRIREYARTVDALLPSALTSKEGLADNLLCYAWINFHKTSMSYVLNELTCSGYELLTDSNQPITGTSFRVDAQFDDSLVFSPKQALELGCHKLVQQGCLVIQDKTSMYGPQSAIALLNHANDDILIIDHGCGITTAHLSSLMKSAKKGGTIYHFGTRSTEHRSEVQMNLDILDVTSVKLIEETLDNIENDDPRLRNVKVVLMHGKCSKSAVQDPVGFVITEGEDVSILQDLSLGTPSAQRVSEMTKHNLSDLKCAMKFPKVQAAVYVTRSCDSSENDKVIMKAIEAYNTEENRKHLFRVTPPVITLDRKSIDDTINDKYYRQMPTKHTNGCFVALVTREVEHVKDNHQAILQRAAATGLLTESGGDGYPEPSGDKVKVKKSKTKSKKSASASSTASVSKQRLKKSAAKRVIAFGTSSGHAL